jgi:hypothetical protein
VRLYRDQWSILSIEFKYKDGDFSASGDVTELYDELVLESGECLVRIVQYMDLIETDGDGTGHKRRVELTTSSGRTVQTTAVNPPTPDAAPLVLQAPPSMCITDALLNTDAVRANALTEVSFSACMGDPNVGGTCKPGFCVNRGAQNVCDDPSYARINDEEGCREVASTLGLQYKGAAQLDYCARGCFVYDGRAEGYGVYLNTHPQGGESADHHLICARGVRCFGEVGGELLQVLPCARNLDCVCACVFKSVSTMHVNQMSCAFVRRLFASLCSCTRLCIALCLRALRFAVFPCVEFLV